MSGLLIKGEFIVDEVIGFGTTGEVFNDGFPLPISVFEFPDCTDMVGAGNICVPPLFAMVWECTHDDKPWRNSCGWRKGSLVMVGTQAASLLRVERTKDNNAAITLGSAIRSVDCARVCCHDTHSADR